MKQTMGVILRLLITPVLLIALLLFFNSCDKEEDLEINSECNLDIDTLDFSFSIDYDDPEKYLAPGEQSDLKDSYFEEIRTVMGIPTHTIAGILQVCHWVNQNFTFENAGGAMMGVNTVDELYEKNKFYGCHSAALIISSILREFGFPAVMIETASVQWAYEYKTGSIQYFSGHVMSEIFVNNQWILLDNNCTYVEDYDYLNPFISTMNSNPDDYFVYAKGVDIWDYSERDESFTHNEMLNFSNNIYCFEEMFNTVTYTWDN